MSDPAEARARRPDERWRTWTRTLVAGAVLSVVVHAGLVLALFNVPPPRPEPPRYQRPPVTVRLTTREQEKKQEPVQVEEKKPEPPKPEEKNPEPPKPEEKKPEEKMPEEKKPEEKKPTERRKRAEKKPEEKKREEKKPEPPQPPAAPQPPAKKFAYDLPEGPGGTVPLPTGGGEDGSRFGDPDGAADGALGAPYQPGAAPAEEPADDGEPEVVSIVETTTPPRRVSQPSAADLDREYPESARRDGMEADVRVSVLVGVDGRVKDVRIDQSGGPAFDAAARKLARRLRYTPAKKGGKPVEVWVPEWFKFRLER